MLPLSIHEKNLIIFVGKRASYLKKKTNLFLLSFLDRLQNFIVIKKLYTPLFVNKLIIACFKKLLVANINLLAVSQKRNNNNNLET
jgi:hypothetical protein